MRTKRRVYSRRVYRNTAALGAAMIVAAVALFFVGIGLADLAPRVLRWVLDMLDVGLLFFGALYTTVGVYGLVTAKKPD
jgi:hypothetical protein